MSINPVRLLVAECYRICCSTGTVQSVSKMGLQIERHLQTDYAEKVSSLKAEDKFNVESFNVYMSQVKRGNYQKFINWGNYGNYLAIFCGKDNFADFKKSPPKLSPEKVNELLSDLFKNMQTEANIPSYFKPKSYFTDLEFGDHSIRVNCISCSLSWAATFLKTKVKEIESNSNFYRYILTEKTGQIHRNRIVEVLKKHPRLKERIEIRTLYNGAFINVLEFEGVAFPINNDVVVYEFYDQHQEEYTKIEAIIGVTPDVSSNEENYSITMNENRGHDILAWFEATWTKIEDTSSKIEVEAYLNSIAVK